MADIDSQIFEDMNSHLESIASLLAGGSGRTRTTTDGAAQFRNLTKNTGLLGTAMSRTTDAVRLMHGSADEFVHHFAGLTRSLVIGEGINLMVRNAMELGRTYSKLSDIGQTFGGSMFEMAKQAGQSGLSLEEFSNLLSKNSATTAQMGAQAMGQLQLGVRNSLKEFGFYGMTLTQLDDATTDYMDSLRQTGQLDKMSSSQQTAAVVDLMSSISAFSQATGKSREEILKGVKAANEEVLSASRRTAEGMTQSQTEAFSSFTAFFASLPGVAGQELPKFFAQLYGTSGNAYFTELGKSLQLAGLPDVAESMNKMVADMTAGIAPVEDMAKEVVNIHDRIQNQERALRARAMSGGPGAQEAQHALNLMISLNGLSDKELVRRINLAKQQQAQDEVMNRYTKDIMLFEDSFHRFTGQFRVGMYRSLSTFFQTFDMGGKTGDKTWDVLNKAMDKFGAAIGTLIGGILSPANLTFLGNQLDEFATWINDIAKNKDFQGALLEFENAIIGTAKIVGSALSGLHRLIQTLVPSFGSGGATVIEVGLLLFGKRLLGGLLGGFFRNFRSMSANTVYLNTRNIVGGGLGGGLGGAGGFEGGLGGGGAGEAPGGRPRGFLGRTFGRGSTFRRVGGGIAGAVAGFAASELLNSMMDALPDFTGKGAIEDVIGIGTTVGLGIGGSALASGIVGTITKRTGAVVEGAVESEVAASGLAAGVPAAGRAMGWLGNIMRGGSLLTRFGGGLAKVTSGLIAAGLVNSVMKFLPNFEGKETLTGVLDTAAGVVMMLWGGRFAKWVITSISGKIMQGIAAAGLGEMAGGVGGRIATLFSRIGGFFTSGLSNIAVTSGRAVASTFSRLGTLFTSGIGLLGRAGSGIAGIFGRMATLTAAGISDLMATPAIASMFTRLGGMFSSGIALLGRAGSGITAVFGRMAALTAAGFSDLFAAMRFGGLFTRLGGMFSSGIALLGRAGSGIAGIFGRMAAMMIAGIAELEIGAKLGGIFTNLGNIFTSGVGLLARAGSGIAGVFGRMAAMTAAGFNDLMATPAIAPMFARFGGMFKSGIALLAEAGSGIVGVFGRMAALTAAGFSDLFAAMSFGGLFTRLGTMFTSGIALLGRAGSGIGGVFGRMAAMTAAGVNDLFASMTFGGLFTRLGGMFRSGIGLLAEAGSGITGVFGRMATMTAAGIAELEVGTKIGGMFARLGGMLSSGIAILGRAGSGIAGVFGRMAAMTAAGVSELLAVPAIGGFFSKIGGVFTSGISVLAEAGSGIAGVFGRMAAMTAAGASSLLESAGITALFTKLGGLFTSGISVLAEAGSGIAGVFARMGSLISAGISGLLESAAVSGVFTKLGGVFKSGVAVLAEAGSGIAGVFGRMAARTAAGIAELEIGARIGGLFTGLGGMLRSGVTVLAEAGSGIAGVFGRMAALTAAGLAELEIGARIGGLFTGLGGMLRSGVTVLAEAGSGIVGVFGRMGASLATGFSELFATAGITAFFGRLGGLFTRGFGGLFGSLGGLLKGFIGKVASPIMVGATVHEALAALDPDDDMGTWIDKHIPLAGMIDNFFSHVGLGRSYKQQEEAQKHHDGTDKKPNDAPAFKGDPTELFEQQVPRIFEQMRSLGVDPTVNPEANAQLISNLQNLTPAAMADAVTRAQTDTTRMAITAPIKDDDSFATLNARLLELTAMRGIDEQQRDQGKASQSTLEEIKSIIQEQTTITNALLHRGNVERMAASRAQDIKSMLR